MKAKIKSNAVGTWLEPYIGHVFTITNSKKTISYLKIYGENIAPAKVKNRYLEFIADEPI